MAEGISAFLPIAMRMVGDAIKLDSQNCKKEAYCQYLSCCMYISEILKDDAWNKDLNVTYNKDTDKLFKLIQRCQERALTIVSESGINPAESPSGSPVLPHSHLSNTVPSPQDNTLELSDSSLPNRDMGKPSQGLVRTSSGSLLKFPSPPPSSPPLGHVTSMKSPSKCNYNQDRRLLGHHLRAAKVNTSHTDKTLTSIRRMSENLVIAKAREEAIRKKVWERQQRLQEEANRRFASAVVASKEEQEQRALYTKILEYEQDMVWPQQLRDKLKQTPEDTALISDIINKIFSSQYHPLRQFLLQYQYHIYRKLLPLLKDVNFPDGKHLHNASNNTAPGEDKDSTTTCPLSKDISNTATELEDQASQLDDKDSTSTCPLSKDITNTATELEDQASQLDDKDSTSTCPLSKDITNTATELEDQASQLDDKDSTSTCPLSKDITNTATELEDQASQLDDKDSTSTCPLSKDITNTATELEDQASQLDDKDSTSTCPLSKDITNTATELEDQASQLDDKDSTSTCPLSKDITKKATEIANQTSTLDGNDSTTTCPLSKDITKKATEIDNQTSRLDDKDSTTTCPLSKDISSINATELEGQTLTLDDKNSTSTYPLGKDTFNKANELEDGQTSTLDGTCTYLVENKSRKNIEDISKADNEDKIDNNEEFDANLNEDNEGINNQDNITTDLVINENEDDFSKINENNSHRKVIEVYKDICNESMNETVWDQGDVSLLVRCIINDILNNVEKAGTESITGKNEQMNRNTEERSGENDPQEQKIHEINKEEIICSNVDTEATNESDQSSDSCKDIISDKTRPEVADSSSFDSNNKRNKNILRIKSFDVESEFESLEDDMFSESSEDEEEADESSASASSVLNERTPEIPETAEVHDKHDENPCPLSHNEEPASAESTRDDTASVGDQNVGDTSQAQIEPTVSHEEDLEETRKQLNEIFVDMRFFLEKLKGFIILAYEELATPIGHDQCYAAVEFPFFQPLWPILLGVLRRLNFDKELSLGCVMTKTIRDPPSEMGVVDRLCLSDQDSLPGNQYPYQPAVEQLHKVATSYCPLEKLDCIVRVLRGICHCVEDYWESKGKPRHCSETSIGCDDLLPVLCYVIVRSGMAQLVSECSAMEEFIPEGYLMGEEGYCLTTLQTALAYLITQE